MKNLSYLLATMCALSLTPAWAAEQKEEPVAPESSQAVIRSQRLLHPVFERLPQGPLGVVLSFFNPGELSRLAFLSRDWNAMTTQAKADQCWNRFSQKPEALTGVLSIMRPMGRPQDEKVTMCLLFAAYLKILMDRSNVYDSSRDRLPCLVNEQFVAWGYGSALERRLIGLSRKYSAADDKVVGQYGYSYNPSLAKQLTDELAAEGKRGAMRRQRVNAFNAVESRALNDRLIDKGDAEAIDYRLQGGFDYPNYERPKKYPNDKKLAFEFMSFWARRGHKLALAQLLLPNKWKFDPKEGAPFSPGMTGDERRALNDALIAQGSEEAFDIKLSLLGDEDNFHCYMKETAHLSKEESIRLNKAEAIRLNEDRIDAGNAAAIVRKLEGLTHGRYGYAKNVATRDVFIRECTAQGCQVVRWWQVLTLGNSRDSYQQEQSRILNETLAAEGYLPALHRKFRALQISEGGTGYPMNHKLTEHFNQLMATFAVGSSALAAPVPVPVPVPAAAAAVPAAAPVGDPDLPSWWRVNAAAAVPAGAADRALEADHEIPWRLPLSSPQPLPIDADAAAAAVVGDDAANDAAIAAAIAEDFARQLHGFTSWQDADL